MPGPVILPIPVWLMTKTSVPLPARPDPAAFLAAIAGTSAAMVAIVGGLLVARFVTIASEQDGADKLVQDASERLGTAQRRLGTAQERLRNWNIRDFFQPKVLRAIKDGENNMVAIRKLGGRTSLTNDELYEAFRVIHTEFRRAQSTLQELLPGDDAQRDYLEWEDFWHLHASSLPEIKWDDAWELVYIDILTGSKQKKSTPHGDYTDRVYFPAVASLAVPTAPEYVKLAEERRDALSADQVRSEQRVEDIEEELARLTRDRNTIVRPKGLGSGLAVLGFFTVVGIILPLWIMSRGPDRLTARLGELVFWLFLAGLLALLGYMNWLALRLSVGRRKPKDKRNDS